MKAIDITNPDLTQLDDLVAELVIAEEQMKYYLKLNPGDRLTTAELEINLHNQRIINQAIARIKTQDRP